VEEFTIIKFLDGGVKHFDKSEKFCLACLTEDGERLVIWGSEGHANNNLNTVSGRSLPFGIQCEVTDPEGKSAVKYGDVYWVDEDAPLGVIR